MFKSSRLLDILFLALLSLYVVAGTREVPFHGDESTQIYMGRDYYIQFVQGDLNQIYYSTTTRNADQDLRLYNGTLPKYIFGYVTTAMGYTLDTWTVPYDWGANYEYNRQYGHLPDEENLYQTRLSSVIGLVIGLWGFFALGQALGGRGVAYIASLYYALNPIILMNGRRAMMEGYLTGFSILVVLYTVWVLQRYQQRQRENSRLTWQDYGLFILWGVMSGLCLASKHTGVITLASAFFAVGLYSVWEFIRTRRAKMPQENTMRLFRGTVASGFIGLLVFYLLNPAWWGSDTYTMFKLVYDLRTDLLNVQVAIFGTYPSFIAKLRAFLDFLFIATPQYYEVSDWQIHIGDQIARYEASPFRGISLGGSVFGGVILGILVVIGIIVLVRGFGDNMAKWVLLWWGLAMGALTLLLTPLEWQRYYLPAYPVIGLLGASGVVWLVRYGFSKWQSRHIQQLETASVSS